VKGSSVKMSFLLKLPHLKFKDKILLSVEIYKLILNFCGNEKNLEKPNQTFFEK
jgi:hypothetical protein